MSSQEQAPPTDDRITILAVKVQEMIRVVRAALKLGMIKWEDAMKSHFPLVNDLGALVTKRVLALQARLLA